MSWDDEVRKIVKKKWLAGQVFTVNQVYQYENHFSNLYPITITFVRNSVRFSNI